MCHATHSYVWHGTFICVTRLIQMRDVAESFVWHDAFIYVTWLIQIRDVSQINQPRHASEWVVSHKWKCHATHMNESRDTSAMLVLLYGAPQSLIYTCVSFIRDMTHATPLLHVVSHTCNTTSPFGRAIYKCGVTHMDECDTTPSFDSSMWLLHSCETTHSSSTHVTRLFHVCDTTSSWADVLGWCITLQSPVFTYGSVKVLYFCLTKPLTIQQKMSSWRFKCDLTNSEGTWLMWRDSLICVTWPIHLCLCFCVALS